MGPERRRRANVLALVRRAKAADVIWRLGAIMSPRYLWAWVQSRWVIGAGEVLYPDVRAMAGSLELGRSVALP